LRGILGSQYNNQRGSPPVIEAPPVDLFEALKDKREIMIKNFKKIYAHPCPRNTKKMQSLHPSVAR
jgi:hypothetical protein